MINLDQLYNLREKIPKNIRRICPKFIRKLVNKKFFRYYFLSTDLGTLPNSNYPEEGNLEYQKGLIEKFDLNKKQTSSMTCPHLMQLLLVKFNLDESFNLLDVGGEKIDFYLDLKKNLRMWITLIYNQTSMIKPFNILLSQYKYDDFNIIENENDLFKINFDFVNFGSCIQYFNNYEEILKKISKNSKYIFFSATHLYDSSEKILEKHIVVKQVNVLPKVNYLYFFNRDRFLKIFQNEKFKLIFENENLTDKINYNNFKKYLRNIQYSDFLLKKE